MQSYVLVVLVVVATVLGHVNARVASGIVVNAILDNEVVEARQCPHKAIPGTISTVPYIMLVRLQQCVKPSASFDRQLGSAPDTDAYRRLFRSACAQVPAVKRCIAAVDADADACLSDDERKLWTTVLDFLDTCIATTCHNDGEQTATLFGEEIKAMTMGNQMRVMSCIYASTAQTLFDREADLPTYTLRKYIAMKMGKQCIMNIAEQGQTSANQFEHFMDKLLANMKCLGPVTNAITPCELVFIENGPPEFYN